jgi:succinyl-CoA synthetase beta subunit
MLLAEHDAKALLEHGGIPVPSGAIIDVGEPIETIDLPSGPWMVKAQVPAGRRGKAGGIEAADTIEGIRSFLDRLAGTSIAGHPVQFARIEQMVSFEQELYFSVGFDTVEGKVRVMVSTDGGVDVEDAAPDRVIARTFEPDSASVLAGLPNLLASLPSNLHERIDAAARALIEAFFSLDAVLLEINPLFLLPDGGWCAGDAKLIVDPNAFFRQKRTLSSIRLAPERYRDTVAKLDTGFDFMILNPEGEIGLLTTGAGLTMMTIDEAVQRGLRPYNFCDIRTGQIHDSPERLVNALDAIKAGAGVRRLLINIFAGITDLENFARRFVEAADIVDISKLRIVARLIGRNQDRAIEILNDSNLSIAVVDTLDAALSQLAAAND